MALLFDSKFLLQSLNATNTVLTHLKPTIPFCVFQKSELSLPQNAQNILIPLNRFVDPNILRNQNLLFSLWSSQHLQAVQRIHPKAVPDQAKYMIRNPFKSDELILKSLSMGINTMFIENFEQLYKVHEKRCIHNGSSKNHTKSELNFVWKIENADEGIESIKQLSNYGINLHGIALDYNGSKDMETVKEITDRVLSLGQKLSKVYLETTSEELQGKSSELQRERLYLKKKQVQCILEVSNYKTTPKCFIASRIIGKDKRNRLILTEESQHYRSSPQNLQEGQSEAEFGAITVNKDGKEWLISSIQHYPEWKVMQRHMTEGLVKQLV